MSATRRQRAGRGVGALRRALRGPRTKPGRRRAGRPSAIDLIGLDVSQPSGRLRSRSIAPILAAVLVSSLLLVVLRTEVLRLRYALADTVAEEQKLSGQKRSLTVAMRRLRDPGRLHRQARELGFERPEHPIRLSEDSRLPDAPGARLAATATDSRP